MKILFLTSGQENAPVTEEVWLKLLTLPLYPGMTEDEFEKVISKIIKFGESDNL